MIKWWNDLPTGVQSLLVITFYVIAIGFLIVDPT